MFTPSLVSNIQSYTQFVIFQAFRERGNCSPTFLERRGPPPSSSKPLAALSLVGVVMLGAALGTASAWEDCVVSPDDKWKPATERTPALKMRYEFERRYTCSNERGAREGGGCTPRVLVVYIFYRCARAGAVRIGVASSVEKGGEGSYLDLLDLCTDCCVWRSVRR